MAEGYIKLHRSFLNKGYYTKPEYAHIWVYLLLCASYKEKEYFINSSNILLKPGQFITSRQQIAVNTGVQESKVERILKCFETEQQIEQQGYSKYRIISILNWEQYQNIEQQNEPEVNSKRTASEQQVNTINKDNKEKKDKKEKKEDNICPHKDIINLWSSILPELIQPQKWDEDDQTLLRARWMTSEKTQTLEWWESFFKYIKESPFLMGDIEPKGDHQRFRLRIQWALNKSNFKKINDGVYHNG